MSNPFRWLAPLTVVSLVASPLWAGVAVIGASSGGSAVGGSNGGLYATDGSGNPVDAAPASGDEFTSISETDVTGAPPGGTGTHFTFGPDANFEQSESAAGAIVYFDDLPHGSGANVGGSGLALGGGPKGGPPMPASFSSAAGGRVGGGGGGGGGGGLLFTHGLPQGSLSSAASSGAGGGQSFLQGGGNASSGNASQGGDANHSVQIASFHLATDRFASGPGPVVAGNVLATDHVLASSPLGGETTGFFTSGTWGVVPKVSTALPSSVVMDHAAFSINGMAPAPGSLTVWGLLGLVLGGAGWRHRRRLLALA